MIFELTTRFDVNHRIHSFGFYILPTSVIKLAEWKEHVRKFSKEYNSDLLDPMNLETELDQWKVYWNCQSNENKTQLPDTITETLKSFHHIKHWFPNIYKILCLVAVVPASSNSCERSISRLRILKTYLRSTMEQDRLSSLALAFIYRQIDLPTDSILDNFAKDYPHRLEFIDVLQDATD